MVDEGSSEHKTQVLEIVTRSSGSPPVFANGLIVNRTPQGRVVLHFFLDAMGVPEKISLMSDGDEFFPEFETSGWIRDYVASVVLDPDVISLMASHLESIAAESANEEAEG